VVNEIIRTRIGFSGLLLTDDIDMEALDGTVPERAARAIAAGCDVALNCWAKMDDMIGIAARLPAMSSETAARLDRALAPSASDVTADRAQLVAKRDALLELARDAA
jgi:beta-N-acetylhexosaminidase